MNSLSYKIGLGYFIIILINISIAIFAIYNINQLSAPINQVLKENYNNINAAEQMRHTLTQQELTQLTMLENSIDSTLMARFKNLRNEFLGWHQNALSKISLPREPIILDSLKTMYNTYLSKSDSLHFLVKEKFTYSEIKKIHFNKILPLATKINELCRNLKEINEQAIFNASNKAKGISFKARFLITIFSVVAILISIIASIFFTRRIILPVKKTTETVRKIRRGQFNQKIAITTDDEIAELGIEFNRMTDRLDQHIRDVSGLKKLDQLKSDFMATISHEFKTPLTSINLAIDILLNEKQGQLSATQKELLLQAKNDCTRLTGFARDLLELSKLESGTLPLKIESGKIKKIIKDSLQAFRNRLKQKNIQLAIKINPPDLECMGDHYQLSRVISNLIDNAIHYSCAEGEIIISISSEKENIRFSVTDQGEGIPLESQDLIFDKFFQIGGNKNKGNIGLGLAICKEIINLHNGHIWVESVPGKGSTFVFTIPNKTSVNPESNKAPF
jgi:signal transduction histidine kinase